MFWRCAILLFIFSASISLQKTRAETLTVRMMLDQKDNWPKWAREKTLLSINGRYEGRVDKQFRLAKLHMLLTPARTTALPSSLRAGQRMTISGVLQKSGSRYGLDVSRIAVGRTDHERLSARIEKLDPNRPDLWYPLADEYQPIAEFYSDDFLKTQVRDLKFSAFDRQRELFAGDPPQLLNLIKTGEALGINAAKLQAIRFESVVAMTQAEKPDPEKIRQLIQKQLPGWDDKRAPLAADVEKRFLKEFVAEYETSSEIVRTNLHRRFYRNVRLPQLLRGLKSDGSNGFAISITIKEELPEEQREIERLQKLYVDYRLTRIPFLTRRQLEELDGLLQEFDLHSQREPAIETWLTAQEKRLNNRQLDGLLATADEYLFAFERWKRPEHRTIAVDLLKRGWQQAEENAPREATAIAQRLEQFGWTRLRNEWMTTEDVASLPKGDIDLAMREGRVVVGMKAPQIVGAAGHPDRKIRVISAQLVQEIWVYSAFVVHMERRRRQPSDKAVATLVSRRAD